MQLIIWSVLSVIFETHGIELPMEKTNYSKLSTCPAEHQMSAVRAASRCGPIKKVLKLPFPSDSDVHMITPQHIEVSLCGGGCHNDKQSCVSIKKRTRLVPVILSKCGTGHGVCEKECATIPVEEDTHCKCKCLEEQEVECTGGPNGNHSHYFNEHLCRCECRDTEAKKLCHDQGRIWDSDTCVCRCPVSLLKTCSTGFKFDHQVTCACIPELDETAAKNKENSVNEERVERSHNNNPRGSDKIFEVSKTTGISTEIIVIVALSGLCTVFFLIIITLLGNIRNLRRRITMEDKQHLDLQEKDTLLKSSLSASQADTKCEVKILTSDNQTYRNYNNQFI